MRTRETDTLPPSSGEGTPDPSSSWVLVVIGWLFASISVIGLRTRNGDPGATSAPPVRLRASAEEHERPTQDPSTPQEPRSVTGPSPAEDVDLRRSPPRELRRLPGIGPLRAAAIAEWRWQRGGAPFALQEVHGIGPRIEARALRALADAEPDESDPIGGLPRDGPR